MMCQRRTMVGCVLVTHTLTDWMLFSADTASTERQTRASAPKRSAKGKEKEHDV